MNYQHEPVNGPGPVRMPGRQTRPNPNPLPIR
jgi:hypothetical protein